MELDYDLTENGPVWAACEMCPDQYAVYLENAGGFYCFHCSFLVEHLAPAKQAYEKFQKKRPLDREIPGGRKRIKHTRKDKYSHNSPE